VRRAADTAPDRHGRLALIVGLLALLAVAMIAIFVLAGGDTAPAPERPAADALSADQVLGERPRVEVLNAGGVSGLARRATERLRDAGFDVVYFGNAGDFDLDSTTVIARTEDITPARAVADALGVDRVTVEPDPELYLDVTVRLGRDWP